VSASPVLVIGGTRGTGLLIAQRLERNGDAVRVLARDPPRAAERLGGTIELVHGDITDEATLPDAIDGARAIIFTAGCRSGHPVREAEVRRTEYQGVLNTLAAARHVGFTGRLLYMTSSGVGTRSFWTRSLNLYKGNTLEWRWRAEGAIRESAVGYTVIRAGVLVNRQAGTHEIRFTQRSLPLSPRNRIARADVAAAFVAALEHPRAVRATFEIVWGRAGAAPQRWPALMDQLVPDAARSQ
jgi:uncharacterized protein YbjT (DUF2867 family)